MRWLALWMLAVLVASAPAAARNGVDEAVLRERAEAIVAVMKGERQAGEVFSPAFTAAVPPPRLLALAAELEAGNGPLEALENVTPAAAPGSAAISLRYQRAIARGQFQLEPEAPHLVSGFRITGFVPRNDGGLSLEAQIAALPGQTSALLLPLDGGAALLSRDPARQLAIGSTAKLYVLAALVRAVDEERVRWDDVVRLSQHSHPSGMLQDWPHGTALTVETLAALMIAISDNTATDELIALLGREAIEAELARAGHAEPQRSLPFLTTGELFVLKAGDEARMARYAAADLAGRRAILAGLAQETTSRERIDAAFAGGPRALEIEWFASAADLARLLARLGEDPIARRLLAINRGLGGDATQGFAYVGYKGGSEPGVLNLSWLLRDAGGRDWALVLSWNDPAANVSEPRLLAIATAALDAIARLDE